AEQGDHVGLVDRAGPAHELAQVTGRPLAEAGEPRGRLRLRPPARSRYPPRAREVVKGDDRFEADVPTDLAHGPVVVEGDGGELAVLGFDPAPLEGEAVAVEAELGQQPDGVGVAV